MRNVAKIRSRLFLSRVEQLPLFSIDDMASLDLPPSYRKTLLSRYTKTGKLERIKKGVYAATTFLATARESQVFDAYLEFLAGAIYPPAYLSLDYVLHQHGLLTEMPHNFTAVAKNKTARFSSALGNFFFHKIKDSLFTGFTVTPVRLKRHMLLIFKATKAKALFDYLYLRKNILTDRESVRALRLNTRLLTGPERREVERLARLEGSHKMAVIIKHLW